jgi:hypothetical protein
MSKEVVESKRTEPLFHHKIEIWSGCSNHETHCGQCGAQRISRHSQSNSRLSGLSPRSRIESIAASAASRGQRERVLLNPTSDFFSKGMVADETRKEIADIIDRYENLDFIVITNRYENVNSSLIRMFSLNDSYKWIPENIWIGISIPNQSFFDAAFSTNGWFSRSTIADPSIRIGVFYPMAERIDLRECDFDWAIIGGDICREGKSRDCAIPFEIDCAKNLTESLDLASVPIYVDSIGSNPTIGGNVFETDDKTGKNDILWPEELRRFEIPM